MAFKCCSSSCVGLAWHHEKLGGLVLRTLKPTKSTGRRHFVDDMHPSPETRIWVLAVVLAKD